jgi:hypothetical protein
MNLEEILTLWKTDSIMDSSELTNEGARVPVLHHKYLSLYTNENLKLRFLNSQMRQLKLKKHEFYIQGPSKEDVAKGWELPPRGKVLRQDAPLYIDADQHINDLQLKIDYAKEKVDTLTKIIDQINQRSYLIGHMIADTRWKGGN